MIGRVLRDSSVYTIAGIVVRGIAFILLPLYTRVLAPAEYGIVDSLTILAGLLQMVLTLEITQGLGRQYAVRGEEQALTYASTALWFTAGMYGAAALVAVAAAPQLAQWLAGAAGAQANPLQIVHTAGLSLLAYGLLYFSLNQLRWELRPRAYATVSLLSGSVTVVATLFLVSTRFGRLHAVILGQLAGNAAGAVVGLWMTRRTIGHRIDFSKLREMLAFSLPLVPSGIAVMTATYIDRVSIAKLMTIGDVGVFGLGYRIVSVLAIVFAGFQAALTPQLFKHHRDEATRHHLAMLLSVYVSLALFLCAALGVFSREIVHLFAPQGFGRAAFVVPLLAPAVVLASMYVFAPGPALTGRSWLIATNNFVVAALNLGLNFVLIPRLGIVGAAAATLVGAAVGFILLMRDSQRLYRVPHAWGALAGRAGLAALLVAASYLFPALHVGSIVARAIAVAAFGGLLLFGHRDLLARLHRRVAPGTA